MKLSDVRKMAIRQQTRVRFRLSDGQQCVIDEHGIARVPGIRDVPQLNLETEFASISEAQLESAVPLAKPGLRTVKRAELEKLVTAQPAAEAADDHDE